MFSYNQLFFSFFSCYTVFNSLPNANMILKLTNTLHYKLISDYNLGAAKDIIETLCWFEKSVTFAKYTAPSNLLHLTAMTLSNLL